MKSVIAVIGKGKENSVDRGRLAELTGMCDRTNREKLEDVKPTVPVMNDQDGKGYYIATEDELQAALARYNREMKRAKKIMRGCGGLRILLKTHGQISFFDDFLLDVAGVFK